ncbi:hypothetical protein [Enterobacter asburiae]
MAQKQVFCPHTSIGELLGFDAIFGAGKRIDSGNYQPDDLELLDGHWDVAERLSEAFSNAQLPPFDPDKPAGEVSGGERIRALLCPALPAEEDFMLLELSLIHI